MSIEPINPTSVAVTTFADLSTVILDTAYTNITTIYIADDFTIDGIVIPAARMQLIIDGKDLSDPTGNTIHTLTDPNIDGQTRNISYQTPGGTVSVTFRNLKWVGYNSSGIFYTPTAGTYQNVTLILQNVTYTGPCVTRNPSGTTRILDCNINIVQGYSGAKEIGYVAKVEIGGNTVLNHTDSSIQATYCGFWFYGSGSSVNILPGANVTLSTSTSVTKGGGVPLTVGAGAKFYVTTQSGFVYGIYNSIGATVIDKGADFRVIQTSPYGTVPTIICSSFTVNEGASVYIQANYAGASPLLQIPSSFRLTLNNPKSFVLYNASASVFSTTGTTPFTINAQQINYWTSVTPLATAGSAADDPDYSWHKADNSLAQVTGTFTSAGTTVTSSNFTSDELADKPLSFLQLQTVKQFSVGSLPLSIDRVVEGDTQIKGTTDPQAGNVSLAVQGMGTYSVPIQADGSFIHTTSSLALGITITATDHIPFLTSTFVRVVESLGELTLLDVPEFMPFILSVIATTPVTLYGREDGAWKLTVSDTRVYSGTWYLYATIAGPLTSQTNPDHTVPGALVYVNDSDNVTQLSEEPVLVFTGEGNGGADKITDVFWEPVKGILLQAVNVPYYNGEHYRADITWTLSDTAIDG